MNSRIHFRVLEKRRETSDTVSLVLQGIEGPVDYKAGQFLTLLLEIDGREIRRSYSFSSCPGIDPYPVITVKRKPNGVASTYLVEKIQPGQVLAAYPPAGQFLLPSWPNGPHQLVMIAGGSGITPVFSLIKSALAHTTAFKVLLIYASRNEQNLIFGRELLQWLSGYPTRFKTLFLLSTPQEEPVHREQGGHVEIRPGRLGNALLEELILENVPAGQPADFYLCGPPGLLLKSEMTLRFMGYAAARIHKEVFIITHPFRPPSELFPSGTVTLFRGKERISFPIEAGQTILEAAESTGLELPHSCRSGICTSCTARCRAGEVMMYLPDGPLSSAATKGVIQTCVGYPLTEHTEISLD